MARLTLKDETGYVTLDLSKSICRFLAKYTYKVDSRPGSIYNHQPPLIVDLGKAVDKDKYWFYVPHGAVRYGNSSSKEYFMVSTIGVEIVTKSDLKNGNNYADLSALDAVFHKLSADRLYLIAYDARIYNHQTTQASVIYVGTR